MRRVRALLAIVVLLTLVVNTFAPVGLALSRDMRRAIMKAAVLITPLKLDRSGRVVNIPWNGSGTIVDASGLILTNYHVVQETPDWDILGISITSESDQPPTPSYLAEFVTGDEDVDLAVIRIVADADGKAVDVSKLALAPVGLGDADDLELGDDLTVFGYPGIGSSTITLTEGKVSGFLQEDGVSYKRAWIKTDAAISGGNSGGTAVDADGKLVAVPTRLGDIDVRRIADTNGDGIVDEYDDAVSTGGFINQLRPVNLALPFIEQARKAGVKGDAGQLPKLGSPTPSATPSGQATPVPTPSRGAAAPAMSPFIFASEVDQWGDPLDEGDTFYGDVYELNAFTDYSGLTDRAACDYEWSVDGEVVADATFPWDGGAKGTYSFTLGNNGALLPEGEYELSVWMSGKLLQSGAATIVGGGDYGVTLSGYIYDIDTGRAIQGAYFYVLAAGVTVDQFLSRQLSSQLAGYGVTNRNGYYVVSPALERGETYGAVVYAQGYELIAEDDALPIDNTLPDSVELDPIGLTQE